MREEGERKRVQSVLFVCAHNAVRSPMAEAIDMGRRGLHDEAAKLLMERLDGKVTIDFDTARRIFTLIFALHWKG